MNVDDQSKVLMRGKVFLYREKAPFIPSGMSVRGALEFNEADDKVRCHECGDWFYSVSRHVRLHNMTVAEYKKRHGLRAVTALDSEGLRAKLIKRGLESFATSRLMDPEVSNRSHEGARAFRISKTGGGSKHATEVKNEDGRCHAQLLYRLQRVADRVGHTPSIAELAEDGISHTSLLVSFNVKKLADVMSLLGMTPNHLGGPANTRGGKKIGRKTEYTKALCIELLRDFWSKHGRLPSGSDLRRRLLPTHTTIDKLFGSMGALYEEAGFAEQARQRRLDVAAAAARAGATARSSVSQEVKNAWARAGWVSRRQRQAAGQTICS